MLQRPHVELGLELVVGGKRVEILVGGEVVSADGAAIDQPKGRAGARRREAAGLHLDVIELIVQVAHILAHREDVVEAVLEFVAEGCLLVFQALIVEVAGKEIPWNLSVGAGHQRALDRQQREGATLRVLAVARQEGDRGVDIRTPGPGRRDRESLLADIVDLGVGAETDAGDAVEQRLVLVHGTADVERALDAVERSALHRDLAERFFGRALADEIEDAAGRGRAVQDRRRSGDDFGALEKIGIDTRRAERPALQPQPVQIRFDGETARANFLEAEVGIVAEIDAGRIAQEIADALRAPHVHFFAGDDGDRARRRHDRRIRLGGARSAARDKAVGAGVDAFRGRYHRCGLLAVVPSGWPAEWTAGFLRAARAVLRRGWTGRCARCAGASTVTGGKADAPGWPVFCAFDGEAVISKPPNASTLAVPLNVLSCEREITRQPRPCAVHSMSVPHPANAAPAG